MNSLANQTVVRMKDFRASDVGDRVTKALGDLQTKAVTAAKSTDSYVRTSPWQAAGAVALAGLVTGVVVTLTARRARGRVEVDSLDPSSEVSGG